MVSAGFTSSRPKVIIVTLLLFAGAIFVLFPFFWMMVTALKEPGTALKVEFIPSPFSIEGFRNMYTWQNIMKVWKDFQFATYFKNSIIVATSAAFFGTLFATMAGYAFAKKEFPGKTFLFFLLISTMMIPGMMYMIPQFVIVVQMGWYNSFMAMIVPHLANVFGLMMIMQYVKTIPSSLIEAARIDGAGEASIFFRIILPLAAPIVMTLFLLTFLFHWTNFLWQLVVSDPGLTTDIRTIPVGLALFRGQYGAEWELQMAAGLFSIIPIAILFLFAQRFFIEGMTQGAVKE